MVDTTDLVRWFLRKESHAQCFIRDICQATPSSQRNGNFFWYLGTVPFCVARFVGIVIGIKIYDRRSFYFVDDGTATIQCIYLHPVSKTRVSIVNTLNVSVEPLCDVGATVHIVGRVESWRDTRQVTIDDITPTNTGEELKHWMQTSHLHKTYYNEPFVIPLLPAPSSLAKPATTSLTNDSTKGSSIQFSISKLLSTNAIQSEHELLRLRHPSRLRSKELTKNVFKIYLKNYMDIVSHNSICAHRENFNIETLCRRSHFKGFRLSYLRRIPELYALCKRISALESASSGDVNRSSVKKTFIWAIRELIKEGTVILHDKDGPVWESLNHLTPIWRISQNNDDSRSSKTKSDIMKNTTNFLRQMDEEGEISDSPPKEESYIPLVPEVLCPSILNILKDVSKLKRRDPPQPELSIREIRHRLNQDMRWEYVGDYIIMDSLLLLEKTGTVQHVHNGGWRFQ